MSVQQRLQRRDFNIKQWTDPKTGAPLPNVPPAIAKQIGDDNEALGFDRNGHVQPNAPEGMGMIGGMLRKMGVEPSGAPGVTEPTMPSGAPPTTDYQKWAGANATIAKHDAQGNVVGTRTLPISNRRMDELRGIPGKVGRNLSAIGDVLKQVPNMPAEADAYINDLLRHLGWR